MTRADDWPRTGRLLPWLLAVFLVVVWLLPSDAMDVPVPLPLDAHPDRFLLLALVVATAASILARGTYRAGSPARTVSLAILAVLATGLLSLAVNAHRLVSLGELHQGRKQLVVLVSILALFFVVATAIRPAELPAFGRLIVVLATLTALGTIWEYRTGYNVFYDLAAKAFGHVMTVRPRPFSTGDSRAETVGPTQHGLAVTTMLTIAMPFAILGALAARQRASRALHALAAMLMFAAAVATQRKTSIVAPATCVLVLAAYRPREIVRLAPLGAVLLVLIHVMAPSALGGIVGQFTGGALADSGSTIHRTTAYDAVRPDIATYPLLGRGYGTIDPTRADTYRILDNQYLGVVIQVGFAGLAAYLALVAAAMALAHGVVRRGLDADRRRMGLVALAGLVPFAVANALFDALSFTEVPYLFCIVAGFASVAAANRLPGPVPRPARGRPAERARCPAPGARTGRPWPGRTKAAA